MGRGQSGTALIDIRLMGIGKTQGGCIGACNSLDGVLQWQGLSGFKALSAQYSSACALPIMRELRFLPAQLLELSCGCHSEVSPTLLLPSQQACRDYSLWSLGRSTAAESCTSKREIVQGSLHAHWQRGSVLWPHFFRPGSNISTCILLQWPSCLVLCRLVRRHVRTEVVSCDAIGWQM
jgi:hypothetical protein